MNDIEIITNVSNEANDLIDLRNAKLARRNIYRNMVRHFGAEARFTGPMDTIDAEVKVLQEDIDFKMAFVSMKLAELTA